MTRPYSRFIVPGFGLALLGFSSVLYVFDRAGYQALLQAWMLRPFSHPFIDWEFLPAAAECWSQGVNVYVETPCYAPIAHMPHPYSPLWLRFSFLPTGHTAVVVFGLGWAITFFLSLIYLPAPRNRRELVLTLLTLGSGLTAFAIERGNIDLIMFLLTVLGVAFWLRSFPSRVLAYAVFMFAGLLKFYPLVLLVLLLRERPRAFFVLSAVCGIALVAFALAFGPELIAVSRNIPKGSYFTDLFGAVNLPGGLPVLLTYIRSRTGVLPESVFNLLRAWLPPVSLVTLLGLTAAGAVWLTTRGGMQEALRALPARRKGLLLAGALLVCGCFFAGQSIGYRGILLLLLLPGLFQIERELWAGSRQLIAWATYAIVFVAWGLTLQFLLGVAGLGDMFNAGASKYGLLLWLIHELAWWWIVGVLLSTVLSFVMTSTMGRWVQLELMSATHAVGSDTWPEKCEPVQRRRGSISGFRPRCLPERPAAALTAAPTLRPVADLPLPGESIGRAAPARDEDTPP